jgi:hypothetical protein
MIVNGKWKIDLSAPHQVYKNGINKRLPGVTTVMGVFDKPALKRWGLGMERDSILRAMEHSTAPEVSGLRADIEAALPEPNAKGDPVYFCEQFTSRAADIGTVAHARCEAFLHGVELDEDGLDHELIDKSTNGFVRFHDWWKEGHFRLVHSELQMVSEVMQCGGTADIIAADGNDRVTLIDLKTSKASRWWPYPEVFGQTAAYAMMYNERVRMKAVERIVVVRIGKEEADPGQAYEIQPGEREMGERLFRAAIEAYNIRKELDRG